MWIKVFLPSQNLVDSAGLGRKKNIQDWQDGSAAKGITIKTDDLVGMPGTHEWERKDAHNLFSHHHMNAMACPVYSPQYMFFLFLSFFSKKGDTQFRVGLVVHDC